MEEWMRARFWRVSRSMGRDRRVWGGSNWIWRTNIEVKVKEEEKRSQQRYSFALYTFILFYFTILYWFCNTSTWILHRCTWVPNPEPPSHLSPHNISLGHPSPKHPVSCIEHRLAIRFLHDRIHVSMPFSQIIPPSPSPTESKILFYTSVSL